MFRFIGLCLGTLVRLLRARRSLLLENLALRQQLAVRKRRHPRPRLDLLDKLFWVAVRRFWSGWQQSLIVVTPETVVRWHRAGFRLYWKLISKVRRPVGRRQTSKEIRELIFRMVVENSTWGAPRIHGEILMLGFDVSERTISRWMKRAPSLEIRSQPGAGLPFSAITGKRLPRWTSSLFRRSPSARSIAFSSSVTTVGVSCTSISQSIRPAHGSSSSCEKHCHLDPLRGSSSLIVMPSMDWRSPQRFDPKSSQIGVSIIPGETALTRTGASSRASRRARASKAALMAPWRTAVANGRSLRNPEIRVNEPPSLIRAARATR